METEVNDYLLFTHIFMIENQLINLPIYPTSIYLFFLALPTHERYLAVGLLPGWFILL